MTWNRTAILAALPVAAVAVIAGVVSYSHIEALGLATGQSITDARLLPLAVDGLIVAGSVILLAGSWLGWIGVALGVGGTVYANVMSGLPRGPLAATVAAWPALAFTVASFMLERWLASQATDVPETVPGPEAFADTRTALYRLFGEAGELLYVGISHVPEFRFYDHARLKEWWPEVREKSIEWFDSRDEALAAERTAIAAEHPRYNILPGIVPFAPGPYLNGSGIDPAEAKPFADELARGEVPTIRRIRAELHVGQPRAQEIQNRLAALTRTQ